MRLNFQERLAPVATIEIADEMAAHLVDLYGEMNFLSFFSALGIAGRLILKARCDDSGHDWSGETVLAESRKVIDSLASVYTHDTVCTLGAILAALTGICESYRLTMEHGCDE